MNKILIVITLLCSCVPYASAQIDPDADKEANAGAGLLLLSTTTGLIALAGIGTYALSKRDDDHASLYLRENNANIQEALASGEGVFVDDMVAVFQVPSKDRVRFATALTDHYTELTDLATLDRLTEARTHTFFNKIQQIRESLASS